MYNPFCNLIIRFNSLLILPVVSAFLSWCPLVARCLPVPVPLHDVLHGGPLPRTAGELAVRGVAHRGLYWRRGRCTRSVPLVLRFVFAAPSMTLIVFLIIICPCASPALVLAPALALFPSFVFPALPWLLLARAVGPSSWRCFAFDELLL